MNFTTRTVYDEDTLLEFNLHFAISHRGFWIFLALVDFTVLFAVVLGVAAFGFTFENIAFIAGAAAINLFALFVMLVMPRIAVKKSASLGAAESFTFLEEKLLYAVESEKGSRQGEIVYQAIRKATRSKNLYCLFIQPNAAFLISRAGLSEAGVSISDFECFLLRVLGEGKVKFTPSEE